MTDNIIIKCCGGRERYRGECLKERCPAYSVAKEKVQSEWPRLPTGYGNAYGEPNHSNYLGQVAQDVQGETKKVE
jgi:hypothetical protein